MADAHGGVGSAPPTLRWSKLETAARRNGEMPTRRSGHSLSIVGSSGYLFGGCDYAEPPGPTNDLFALKINANAPSEWERLRSPLGGVWPPPRWKHSATVVDNKIYVFGGFHSSSTRFNDLWIFNPITLDWSQSGAVGAVNSPLNNNALHRASVAKSAALTLPAPRGAHTAVAIRRSIYVFGGYGGTGYGRRDFDDLYMLRADDLSWTKVTCKGKPPEKRAGHQACAVDDLMLVCGGWNSVTQFNDLHIFDSTVNSWTLVEGTHMATTLPRWNHACCAVLAIPHAKVFVFGGVVGEANNYNAQGNYMNDLSVLDTGDMSWTIPEIEGTPPCGRSDTTLAYDDKGSRLIVFGGWANVWLNDMFYLDVSCVVGPPYGITGIFPNFGPITGGTSLVIEGIDFVNKPVIIRFSCRKGSVDIPGEYVNDHTLNVVTPDFTAFPAGDAQVRVALQGDSFTTTFQTYSYFSVTHAPLCFAYGPGVLSGGASGEPTCFIIQARDAQRNLRTRGGDEFTVEVSIDESDPIFMPSLQIQDLLNGKYLVSYTAPNPGEYHVKIEFQGTFGGNAGLIRGSPYTATFDDIVTREMNLMTGKLVLDQVLHDLQGLQQSTRECNIGLEQPLSDPTWTPEQVTAALIGLKEHVFMVEKRGEEISLSIEELRAEIAFLKDAGILVTKELDILMAIEMAWAEVLKKVPAASNRIAPLIATQSLKFRDEVGAYMEKLHTKETHLKSKSFWSFSIGVDAALALITEEQTNAEKDDTEFQQKKHIAEILECEDLMEPCASVLTAIQRTLTHCHQMWDAISEVTRKIDLSRDIPWSMIDGIVLEEEAKAFLALVKATHKDIRDCDAFKKFERLVKDFLSTCPLFQALRHPSMRRRHWQDLIAVTGKDFECPEDNPSMKFADILALNLHEFQRDVEEITDRAQKEAKQESVLQELETRWSSICLTMTPYKETTVPLLAMTEDDVEMLESDQLLVQGMAAGRNSFFQEQTQLWKSKLMLVSETVGALLDIQRSWSYLEPLFMQSEEVKRELPDEAARFEDVDELVRQTLQQMWEQEPPGNVLLACQLPGLLTLLNDLRTRLEKCQQALKEYLDSKRRLFPRFYFISEADLLDILSNGSSPQKIMVHLEKVFLATHTLLLEKANAGAASSMFATHFISNDAAKEVISFESKVLLDGKVELYMQTILEAMQCTLKEHVTRSINRFPEQNRVDWLLQKAPPVNEGAVSKDNLDAAQIALLVAGIEYARSVENSFELISKGHATAMKELLEKVVIQLNDLIKLTQTNLPKADRQRTMCMITVDAHSRDIIQKLLYEEITTPSSFLWQSQLKQRRSDQLNKTYLEICDATFDYGFEYLGNGPRLVITPLTDRIYVTATQALHIQMGCAPAGPAGTGKTETTKDLANMVGKICYVFNCSPEMDYKNLGNIFKGLASAGAWGCFDEFNRLAPEVLSVCSVQFKAVCDGIRSESSHVVVEGDSVTLDPTCGTFITMNPGYLGRSELPEGLKALFRPITVMAPDLVLICENMLMAEGFKEAKLLAAKFFSLYSLLRELLSKQDHYDWGLRAVKSVLVVAGSFKRAEPKLSEQEILMRSLRDFNLPKIVKQDLLVFNGLLSDLFPDMNLPRKIDESMEKYVHVACEDRGLWPHEQFRLKVIQLEELLAIRHCVFVMGPPGSGKTECCETLIAARKKKGEDYVTKVVDINPKAVSTEDLYGYMVLGTREWKDGLLSKIMRDVASSSVTDPRPKWIVLDGDLDANWIESMNSVMDDNKMLTLASNERIPLKPNMRLLFEIRDLKFATPATVSRAGILYISDDDGFQWRSFLASWVATKGTSVPQRTALGEAMNKYIDPILAFVKQCCKTIVPMQEITMVHTYLYFLDAVLDAETLRDSKKVDVLSGFISVWAFGAALTITDDGTDYRKLFSEWWRSEFKHIKFPARDTVFDYWLDPNTLAFDTWRASPYFKPVHFDGSVAMSSVTVPTPETASITSCMSIMVREERPFMLCGNAGTGKTQLVQGLLKSLDVRVPSTKPGAAAPNSSSTASQAAATKGPAASMNINFNYYTNAYALQTILESKLSKRVGSTFGPTIGDQLIYFLDDLNLPQVDTYGTQSAIALLRQYLDYGHWYDRAKFSIKQIVNVQFVSCMNPSAGSFSINPRLQRHFVTFALPQLSAASLQAIYTTFLEGYVADFVEDIRKMSQPIMKAALNLHVQVCSTFRKTAANFHYEFNIRHVANVFQGLLMAKPPTFEDPLKFALLWAHETSRVYGDRMVSTQDIAKFTSIVQQQARKCFPALNFTRYFAPISSSNESANESALLQTDPILFCHFANGLRTNEYDQVVSYQVLHATVEEALAEHNELNTKMELVLFKDALEHIARIVRIISNPSGHALLVGVGGSGRKSLARLSAFICGYALVEIAISQAYSLLDFKSDLQNMFMKAGVKGDGVVFLFDDNQIKNERMLVYLNDLLSSGNIPDLYSSDEQTNLIQQFQPKMIAALAASATADPSGDSNGIIGLGSEGSEKERAWRWFVQEIKRNLHVVLCFSPAAPDFRMRARKFPALVNCSLIDWFQPWPKEALRSVAARFLSFDNVPQLNTTDNVAMAIQNFMPFAFQSTNILTKEFFAHEKRHVYSTPKSYLECLTLYRRLLAQKHSSHQKAIQRLQTGLEKMESTGEIVATMEEELKRTLEEAEKKKVIVEELAARLQKDKEIVETETARANVERERCAVIQADVSIKKADTEADLAQAQPMVDAAMAALDTLNKKDLGNCKTMAKPPAGVGDIFGAVVVLFAGVNPNIIVQKNGKVKDKDRSWEATKKALLGNINALVEELKGFKTLVDNQQVPEINWKEIRPFLQLEHFNVEIIEKKNSASAGLCAWVINIVAYYDAIIVVEPKKRALEEANEKLRVANERLELVNQKVVALEEKLATLTEEFDKINKEVQDAVALLERGRLRMELARRLAKALGSESERWTHELEQLRASAELLVCDVVIAASFVSYVGAFTKPFRDLLINDKWLPFLRKLLTEKLSKADKDKTASATTVMSEDGNPLQILATQSEIAEWSTRGLPSDRVSIENGAIVRNSTRAPLLIDPQLQGIYWLREMEKYARRTAPSSLQVVRQDQPNLSNFLETAVEHGYSVIVENMGEKLDVCLWPVISRSTSVRGHKTLLKMGDKMVELHPDFRLYLHTKLSNPHYPPELQAETTMINFAVTQQGLEDQLLSLVVRKEWPKMAKVRTALIHQQNEFKIRIQTLEDRILSSLADAEGDVTENVQVITDLETTKATAQEIAKKAAKATEYEAQINELSAKYQSVANRGALLFFIMDGLHRMHSYYVYSLNAYVVIFQRGIDLVQQEKDSGRPPSSGGGGLLGRLKAAAKKVIVSQRFQWNADLLLADRVVDSNSEQDLDELMKETDQEEKPSSAQIEARCTQLKTSITDVVFNYIRRGLFEKDKLTLATQLCFSILQAEKKIDAIDIRQLVTCGTASDMGSGMGLLSEWMSETVWLRLRKLEENITSLQKLTTYMRSDSEEWREWCDAEKPELKPMPGQYKTSITPIQLLHIVRVLRPDRMIFALRSYLGDTFGKQMVQQPPFDMEAAYQETSASTPMFFVLFPGVDPTSWVETLGKKFDFTYERGNLINISMGQGQEEYADQVLMKFSREGNWVILQNIHLMQSWLPRLERTLEVYSVSADQRFRCFLSSEGPALASLSNLPESLLQSCIKVANEAPTDLKSNLRRAWANFSMKQLEACAQPNEYQGCLFALCFFHALVLGRRRFGYQGWSRPYSFNTGDLLICSDVLRRYLDTAVTSRSKTLPWDDLRYIFGEIMYGGHITDHWDRITNNAYLNEVFTQDILKGKELTVGFKCPDPFTFSYSKYVDHIETQLPGESPTVYGLHPNAEVGYLVEASNDLFATIAKFQPSTGPSTSAEAKNASSASASGLAKENAHVYAVIEELLGKLPPEIDLADLQAKAEPLLATDQSPYVVVALQEATRMHALLHEIQSSLVELTKGIQGTLNMTEPMEDLMEALSINQVPGRNVLHMCSWERYAWWSRKSLSLWFADLLDRIQFLLNWTSEFRLPYSMWISGLFNPTAFLTAIKQCTARTHGIPLDSMAIETHMTPLVEAEGAESYPEMGAYIHGLFMEGARWEFPMKDGEKTSPFSYEIDSIPCGGHLVDPMPKELLPSAPVIYARAVVIDSKWEATAVGHFRRNKDVFDCPVYQTTLRGPTYVFLATLNTINPQAKWILAGVALVMQRDS
ncbi:Dynein alpha chain, flagellar outer arm [Phytophthora fragariae]|uniref:Dynein alpha chain, flagellar outer arm n=4 Tax=Phytophthora fragariae TaxID=53985 RepID=A0A6G0LK48_9STRA|nr:Dynein alpha chain, flagellar outer arm [Phytophthora fragariae]KAE9249793.1 Dynein alpha chain, flagellar outer arm [Phytophthora fragariae]